jgi:ubiquinone/menaquinone biosynthesis C-methylase UbiE
MLPLDTTEERLKREAEFHDHRYADDTSASRDPFYEVARRAFDRYKEQVLEAPSGLRVLEYGCGPGSQAYDLARAGAQVDGIDISPVAIGMARRAAAARGLADRCTFNVMNAEAMTFPDATFDRIVGSGILHHLDLDKSFREIRRTLKPGGRAIFLEPLGHNPAINWYRRRTPGMRTPDEHPLVQKDLEAAARQFSLVSPEFFHLLVLVLVPLRRSSFFQVAHRLLGMVDDVLLSPRSPLRWTAWIVVLTMEA